MSIASKTELQPVAVEAAPTAAVPTPQARSRSIKPLLGLVPFVMRYRARVVAALIALVVAAVATLAVPVAVRRMIDNGFDAHRAGLIDEYFGVMILVVAVLAGA